VAQNQVHLSPDSPAQDSPTFGFNNSTQIAKTR
jgi:hypothetical protein